MASFVTGATGLVGRHLVTRLLERGDRLRVLVAPGTEADVPARGRDIVSGEITDTDLLSDCIGGCSRVYHLAAQTPAKGVSAAHFQRVNVGGVEAVVAACRKNNVERLVHVSTVGVYGKFQGQPICEASPSLATNPYRASKIAGEQVVRQAVADDGLQAVIARLPDVLGPGALSWLGLAKAILAGGFRTIGDGRNCHQMIDVSDVVDGLLLCGEGSGIENEDYILAGEDQLTADEIIATVRSHLDAPPVAGRLPAGPFRAYVAACEAVYRASRIELPGLYRYGLFLDHKVFATSKAQERLGFRPTVSAVVGIRRTLDWYLSEGLL